MPPVRLTDRLIASHRVAPGDRVDLWDDLVSGLVVRIGGRRRVWYIVYRAAGRKRRYRFAAYPAVGLAKARELARGLLERVARGDDPASDVATAERVPAADEDAPSEERVADLVVLYLVNASGRKKSWREDDRRAAKHILPAWQDMVPDDVTQTHMLTLMQQLRARGAAREPDSVRLLVSAIWRFGRQYVRRDGTRFCAGNPAADIDGAPAVVGDRVLTDPELAAVWRAAGRFRRREYGAIVRLLILTGQRRGEVAGMTAAELSDVEWPDLGYVGRLWTLPGPRTKNGLEHLVPLTDSARRLVDAWRPAGGLVFPVAGRRGRPAPFSAWSKTKEAFDRVASIEMGKVVGAEAAVAIPDWTLHDLRRTVSTNMARLGVPPHIDDRVFNHVSGSSVGVRSVYNHYQYLKERAEALAAWEASLLAIVEREGD